MRNLETVRVPLVPSCPKCHQPNKVRPLTVSGVDFESTCCAASHRSDVEALKTQRENR